MTKLFNKTSEKLKRRELRSNMTKAEAIVWQKLRCKPIENCKFRNQYSQYDEERQVFIELAGIKFLRFTNKDVYENLNGVLETIASKIRQLRGCSLDDRF